MKMTNDELKCLLYQYIMNTSDLLNIQWERLYNNYEKLCRFDIVSRYDLLELHEAQVRKQFFEKVYHDISRILDSSREL